MRQDLLPRALTALLACAAASARADTEVQALAIAAGAVIVAAAVAATPPREEPDAVALEIGRFDAVKRARPAGTLGGEYRVGEDLWWQLRPFAGAGITTQQSLYGYAGIRIATYWGERVVITPSFALGAYRRGEGKDLGNPPVLGRFGIDLEYRLDNDLRVGAAYHHFSNGKALGQRSNPGTEVVGITLLLPIR
jgi:lipid A 3-O-deacylase